jgi:hypothetical protein
MLKNTVSNELSTFRKIPYVLYPSKLISASLDFIPIFSRNEAKIKEEWTKKKKQTDNKFKNSKKFYTEKTIGGTLLYFFRGLRERI